jgi:hypothetical protein
MGGKKVRSFAYEKREKKRKQDVRGCREAAKSCFRFLSHFSQHLLPGCLGLP